MPLAYRAAPIPAAAALSGAAVKSGVIGLIRFLPFAAGFAGWGDGLLTIGLFTAFYGVVIGITQSHPKTILAYSSVSQMGVITAALGLSLAAGNGEIIGIAFYAANHVLVKGALFLAIGAAAASGTRLFWRLIVPAAILALGLGGLPLTGGALAKLAVKDTFGTGLTGALAAASAAGTTLLMLHFLRRLALTAAEDPRVTPPPELVRPWLALACAAIVVPWVLFLATGIGRIGEALAPSALWASLWPVLIGATLSLALHQWRHRLPRVPAGDLLVYSGAALRVARACGDIAAQADTIFRRWPVAGMSLLFLVVALCAALLTGR
jgi:formate hydrogenlyase subunit 3/multisubunit Na+/H+ antiporter MnhD subunit